AGPVSTGVVRDRDHGLADGGREQRTADPEAPRLSEWHARPFRKYDDPQPVLESLASLRDDLLDGCTSAAPVDRDRLQRHQRPPEEWHPHQLTLQHPRLARQ